MEKGGKTNKFANSKRLQKLFQHGDKKGELDEVLEAIQAAGRSIPEHGNIWDVYIDVLYQKNQLLRASIEAAKEKCKDSTSWTCTINQTFKNCIEMGASEKIERAEKFLMTVNKLQESTDVGPCGSKPMQKEKKCENPFEKERLNHLRKATDCTYLRQIAQDVDFMENLLNDRRLKTDRTLPDETNKTNKKLRALFEDTLSKCSWWKKQMHQRTPLYARHKMRFLTKSAKSRAIVAYRMQKRVMNRVKARRILNNVTKLSVGSTKKLLGYIETTVYPFHSTIQENLFPNLKEFIEMIYETVGVVLIREMSEVKTTDVPNFLKLPTKKSKETTDKRKIIKLQNRLRFARYPLEKAYLAHKLFNMITPRLPELRVEAEAAIKELRNAAKTSGSIAWCFISTLSSTHLHYILSNNLETDCYLLEAMEIAYKFPEVIPGKFKKILKNAHKHFLKMISSSTSRSTTTFDAN